MRKAQAIPMYSSTVHYLRPCHAQVSYQVNIPGTSTATTPRLLYFPHPKLSIRAIINSLHAQHTARRKWSTTLGGGGNKSIMEPSLWDILQGRDQLSIRHVGNKCFREVVCSNLEHYKTLSTTTEQKNKFCNAVVESILISGDFFGDKLMIRDGKKSTRMRPK